MTTPQSPELLLPAGSLDKMRAAYDWCRRGVRRPAALQLARAQQRVPPGADRRALTRPTHAAKKFFVTSNLIAHNDKIRTYLRDIEPVIDCKPDALIMADAGPDHDGQGEVARTGGAPLGAGQHHQLGGGEVLAEDGCGAHHPLARTQPWTKSKNPPGMPRHGAGSVRARRAVHAYSGRCLLSGYFNHRDPNQGTCTNACRWNYATHDADIDPTTGEAIAQKMEGDFNFEAAQQKQRPSNRSPPPAAASATPRPTRST